MAYDGIATAAAVKELNDRLLIGSITKVAQPEKDELLLTLKCNRKQLRLTISANASNPMVYIREENTLSPVTAPNFCMALRKHIGGGRIKAVFQPGAHFPKLWSGKHTGTDAVNDAGYSVDTGNTGGTAHTADTGDTGNAMEDDFYGEKPDSYNRSNAPYTDAELANYRGLERIIVFVIEHLDEMGDVGEKLLIVELMGKHSNIILTKDDLTIIDSIKHISHMTSSVREVLPGRRYFIPETVDKADPYALTEDSSAFTALMRSAPVLPLHKKLYMSITGFSPAMAEELIYRTGIDGDMTNDAAEDRDISKLYEAFRTLMEQVLSGCFEPCIIYEGERIAELSGIRLTSLEGGSMHTEFYESMSDVVRLFYEKKDKQNRIRSKSEDIRHTLKILTERAAKKLELLEKQYADTEKRDKFRVYGEMLNTYGYSLKGGEESFECENYYDNGNIIRIPLDKNLSAAENAARYFDKYQKLKRTRDAVGTQLEECGNMLYHLDSISNSLALCESEADLNELRREMAESGYIGGRHIEDRQGNGRSNGSAALRKSAGKGSAGGNQTRGKGQNGSGSGYGFNYGNGSGNGRRKGEEKSRPLHFVSSDGIDIYVGRNNYQNEELDFKVAEGNDWWFHAKNIPGSHVIAKTGNIELPDRTCLEAAALAAYYSKAGATSDKVEVDYVKKRELKRVPGAAPGFVIYHTNYSIMIEPREHIGYNETE